MDEEESRQREQVRARFEASLNQHGYGFQYSVLQTAWNFEKSNNSSFVFEVAEFPAEVQKAGTRIDFILRRSKPNILISNSERPLYLVAECKRVNPALADWCFVRAPFTTRNARVNTLIIDSIQIHDTLEGPFVISRRFPLQRDDFYQIGVDIRSGKQGDAEGHGRGAIEEAATQVLRGLNGFIQFLDEKFLLISGTNGCELMPVIFTTANLWVSSVDLSKADLATGNVLIKPDKFSKVGWLLFQYNQSPGIKHNIIQPSEIGGIGFLLESVYVRTIPIINPSGIEEFFQWASNLDLFP
jgi:hypothetical protein